jgi:glyoxylase I family protein
MNKGMEHTAIATPDPESLAQWYEKTLNFRINHRYGGTDFVNAPDGTMLEFISSVGVSLKTEVKTPGIRHLAIATDYFDADEKDIESKGIKIWERVNAGGNRLAFFSDPEGNILHLIHREQSI